MQWKRLSNYCLQQERCLYSNEFSSALTKCDPCVCMSLHSCVYVWKHRNTIWLVNITCAWLVRLFGTTPSEERFKERKRYAQSVCVCVPMPEWNCVLILSVWVYVVALFWHVVVSQLATEDSKYFELGQQPHEFFLTQNTYFPHACDTHRCAPQAVCMWL